MVLFGLTGFSVATAQWKMQPVVLQTRWAKEVSPANALKDYPRPQLVRQQWQNLNGLWNYAITGKDAPAPATYAGKILVPYPLESALSGVQKELKPDQHLWYKREFTCPVLAKGERLLLHFGAVDYEAAVYVNGKVIGSHSGGYTGFSFDITHALHANNNELVVKVFDPTDKGVGPRGKQVLDPGNIFYTPSSGIWQTVWLEKVPATYIADIKITPDIDKQFLSLTVFADDNEAGCTVEAIAFASGKRIASVTGLPGKEQNLKIGNQRLWSPDDPFLYDLIVRLKKNGKVIDEIRSYFGMRKVSIAKDARGIDRIFLNNKYLYNLGVLDQGFWPDGLYTAPTDEALAFDIRAIKAMGFNTIRKHIKVEPARWYYHADKTGILVWQDMVNPDFQLSESSKAAFEQGCKETIGQLHNYPSITTYTLFNEKWGQYDQERLTKWLRALDPTRLINGHSGEYLYVDDQLRSPSPNAYVEADMTDVHSYPEPMISVKMPGKAQVLGEYGGIGLSVPGHEWNDLQGWGYVQVTANELQGKYAAMTKRLKELEAQGLSGSIYTQPFDVEGEENGLMTYDREMIKIPVKEIREINRTLVNLDKGFTLEPGFVLASNIDMQDNDGKYEAFLSQFKSGKRDSSFLRRLTQIAFRKKDQTNQTLVGNAFIDGLKDPLSKANLQFIRQITQTTQDRGLTFLLKHADTVDAALGRAAVESKLAGIIEKEEVDPFKKAGTGDVDNWDEIQGKVKMKYGVLAESFVTRARMFYYMERKDWVNYGKYYALYFEQALKSSQVEINNASWSVFENVNDPEVIAFACNVMQYVIEYIVQNDGMAYDTYANLLHKAGKTSEAIEWEEKAIQLMKGASAETMKVYTDALEKMQQGKPTWMVTATPVKISLSLPALFSDNMVLQQQRQDPVWGKAEPGSEVLVSFKGKTFSTRTGTDGKWMLRLDKYKAGGPYTMIIKSGDSTLALNNIMIGEVWVCSGQSNMEMPLEGWPNGDGTYRFRIKDYQQEIANAQYPGIRLLQLIPDFQEKEQSDFKVEGKTWRECSPATIPTFSSTAYFFAREVYRQTGVPIGLIESSVGGTFAEHWSSDASLDKLSDFPSAMRQGGFGAGSLFRGMIAPLIPYGIKGVIWYQGEFNSDRAYQYCSLFPEMIKGWRERWGQGDFPFYYVQLPINGEDHSLNVKSIWAELREAQSKTLSLPNTAMAVTIDLPDGDLHPANKQDFGYRLATIALAKEYGRKIEYMAPLYASYQKEGNSFRLFFTDMKKGLMAKDGASLKGFVIAGADSVFHVAEARIEGKTIVVKAAGVSNPVAVRYAWGQAPENNLCSKAGVPVSPFRTDDWPMITRPVTRNK